MNANTLKLSEGKLSEYIVTRHDQFVPAINVINIYGSQETRKSSEEVKDEWEEILQEIINIEAKEEHIILLGDANRHLGQYVHGNHPKTTMGGKLILDLVAKEEYTLVNALENVVNGPFTRYDPKDPQNEVKKSLLDIVIVSTNLLKFIEKLEVDKNLNWTPSRAVKNHLKFPDHYALLLTMKNIPMKHSHTFPPKKYVLWNTRKKDGWLKYREKTDMNQVLLKLAERDDVDPETLLAKIEKELTSVKFAAFGKVKVSSKSKNAIKLEKLQSEKNRIIKEKRVNETESCLL